LREVRIKNKKNGRKRIRTSDPRLVRPMLSP
jgi:hypothetical protein